MQISHVTILGLTPITASIGLLFRHLFQGQGVVVGHSSDPSVIKQALAMDVLDQTPRAWREVVAVTDLLLIDWPLDDVENLYREIGFRLQPHTLVLDFSRLKGFVYQLAQKHLKTQKFIGVIPLLASEQLTRGMASLAAATPDLFANSHFCLVAHPTTNQETLDQAIAFGHLLGAEPLFADPMEYDSLVQATELLPLLSAAALYRTISGSEGWHDMSRFAGMTLASAIHSLEITSDVVHLVGQGKSGTLVWLDALLRELTAIRQLVAQEDSQTLQQYLTTLDESRRQWLERRAVATVGEPSLLAEVEDRNFLRQLFTFKRKT